LNRGTHHSPQLQRAWTKYGADVFIFKPLLLCAPKDLLFYEQRCFDGYLPEYNCSPTAGSPLGVKHTAETRAKFSARQLGKRPSAETRAKMAVAGRKFRHTPESRAKISIANKGKPRTPEHLFGIGSAWRGKAVPLARRLKVSEAMKGKIFTPEHRANLSIACFAREARRRAAA